MPGPPTCTPAFAGCTWSGADMRILMLGDASTPHLGRWGDHFRLRGDTVWIASVQESRYVDFSLPLPVPWPFAGYPLLVPVVKRMIRELKPDILVAHYLPNYGLVAALSGFRPHVIVGWGSDLLVLPKRGPFERARTRLVATRGHAFLVDAQMLVEPLVRFGAPATRVYVCPFGVDDDVLAVGRTTLRPSARSPVVLSNRRLEPAYRVDLLLDALYLISNAHRPFSAVVANAGSAADALRETAAGMGLGESIVWPGNLCRNRYLESLAAADIYVSTSPSDSTSVSLLEAMAAGLAAVVPDIPGNREWIREGHSGLLYPPGDAKALSRAILTLLDSPERAAALGKRARATVEERGRWAHTIRRAELLFDQLTGP